MCIYKLRPHHALCSRFFEGKGYSAEFVSNMTKVLRAMELDPEVELCSRADVICGACPNLEFGACNTSQKVARYDAAVLRMTELKAGQTLRFSRLRALADEKIIFPGKLGEVCGDCNWQEICDAAARKIIISLG